MTTPVPKPHRPAALQARPIDDIERRLLKLEARMEHIRTLIRVAHRYQNLLRLCEAAHSAPDTA